MAALCVCATKRSSGLPWAEICVSTRPRSPQPHLQLQQRIRIAVRELGHVGWGEREAVEEGTTLGIWGIGVVNREHDAVDAEGEQRGEKRRLAEDPAAREPDLIEDG